MNVVQYEERRGQRDEATRDIRLRQKDKRLIGKIARKGRRRVPVAVRARVFVQRGKVGGENSVAGFVAGFLAKKGGYRVGKSILQRVKKRRRKIRRIGKEERGEDRGREVQRGKEPRTRNGTG